MTKNDALIERVMALQVMEAGKMSKSDNFVMEKYVKLEDVLKILQEEENGTD